MKDKLTMLMILDGFGINENEKANAIKMANTPNLDKIVKKYPCRKLHTSGKFVGLPDGQMGNSEVGHTNIGAGRIIYQDLTKITKSIEDGDFFSNEILINAIEKAKEKGSNLHIMGLLSDGGVHSHNRHLYALLELAKRRDFENVYIHAFLDGRDTPPASGEGYLSDLEEKISQKQIGKIASISGRYYAMDRDKRWDREKLAYDAIVNGKGPRYSSSIMAIEDSYQKEVFDEFVVPSLIENSDGTVNTIKDGDLVIMFNFRPDRARQIIRVLTDKDFNEFETQKMDLDVVTFTNYDETLKNVKIAFPKEVIDQTYGEVLQNEGLKQLRIAETEKYAHVTFFFNGGRETPYENEDRILVNSPKVATYDLQPEMSAVEVTDKVIDAINSNKYDSIILNYANPDMVGHTGNLKAAIKAIETIDTCLGRVVDTINNCGANLLIIADHGNAEEMIDYTTGEMHTSHTTNDVPVILISQDSSLKLKPNGRLCDIAPTLLDLLNVKKPEKMTGVSLIDRG